MSVPASGGTGCPVSAQNARTWAGRSPGRRKRSSSGSMKAVNAGAASARAASSSYVGASPAGQSARRHSCTSQSPMTLRSRRIVPATPPSFVRLAARVTPDTTGAATSSPISDHVPDDRNAVRGPASGAPTTADAVSWDPGATTRAPARPVSAATSGRSEPSTVPGCTISGRNPVGMPSRSSKGRAQSRATGSRHWLVLAFVYSATELPHRKWENRSPIISSRSAARSWGSPARAIEKSWKSVLMGMNWIPVAW